MAHLQITGELDSLGTGDDTVSLEDHVGNGLVGDGVTSNQLGNNVVSDLGVGDGVDHAVGNLKDKAHDEADDHAPDGEARDVDLGHHTTDDKAKSQNYEIPPIGGILVLVHQTVVNILVLLAGASPSPHSREALAELTAVVQEDVNDTSHVCAKETKEHDSI